MAIPPEVGVGEAVCARDAAVADGCAVVAHGLAREGDAVLRPCEGGCLVHLDLEGGALVLLHPEIDAGAARLHAVVARQTAFGQDEVGAEDTHGICAHHLAIDLLPVGIAQDELILLVGQSLGVPVLLGVGDAADVHGLSGAVDGAVGVEAQGGGLLLLAQTRRVVEGCADGHPVVLALDGLHQTARALEVGTVETGTALGITQLFLNGFAQTRAAILLQDSHLGLGHGLAALGIHHNHLHAAVGQTALHGHQGGDAEELVLIINALLQGLFLRGGGTVEDGIATHLGGCPAHAVLHGLEGSPRVQGRFEGLDGFAVLADIRGGSLLAAVHGVLAEVLVQAIDDHLRRGGILVFQLPRVFLLRVIDLAARPCQGWPLQLVEAVAHLADAVIARVTFESVLCPSHLLRVRRVGL